MTTYLVDQSIWSRVEHTPAVAAVLSEIARSHTIVTCPPQVLEYCHPARNPSEYRERRADMDSLFGLRRHPTNGDVLDLQQALWDNGLMRAAGTVDLLLAAYAMANDATILSADSDFDAIAHATGDRLRHQLVEVA